ncbi:hypothetical protein GGP42_002523 [Salinibacter ruber]|nr:hypothetical protein [Salinibacter ruber]
MIGSPREWAKDFAFWLLDQRKTRGYHLMNDLWFWMRDRSVDVIFDVGQMLGKLLIDSESIFPVLASRPSNR